MDLSLLEATLMAGVACDTPDVRFGVYQVSLVMSAILIAWADGQLASAATSAKPQGTVTVAFHSFSKEVMDPALDGTPGLPYRGQMFDWFISATPEGSSPRTMARSNAMSPMSMRPPGLSC